MHAMLRIELQRSGYACTHAWNSYRPKTEKKKQVREETRVFRNFRRRLMQKKKKKRQRHSRWRQVSIFVITFENVMDSSQKCVNAASVTSRRVYDVSGSVYAVFRRYCGGFVTYFVMSLM